jgi:hypothetical protein
MLIGYPEDVGVVADGRDDAAQFLGDFNSRCAWRLCSGPAPHLTTGLVHERRPVLADSPTPAQHLALPHARDYRLRAEVITQDQTTPSLDYVSLMGVRYRIAVFGVDEQSAARSIAAVNGYVQAADEAPVRTVFADGSVKEVCRH